VAIAQGSSLPASREVTFHLRDPVAASKANAAQSVVNVEGSFAHAATNTRVPSDETDTAAAMHPAPAESTRLHRTVPAGSYAIVPHLAAPPEMVPMANMSPVTGSTATARPSSA
jgi:hypothetical protein